MKRLFPITIAFAAGLSALPVSAEVLEGRIDEGKQKICTDGIFNVKGVRIPAKPLEVRNPLRIECDVIQFEPGGYITTDRNLILRSKNALRGHVRIVGSGHEGKDGRSSPRIYEVRRGGRAAGGPAGRAGGDASSRVEWKVKNVGLGIKTKVPVTINHSASDGAGGGAGRHGRPGRVGAEGASGRSGSDGVTIVISTASLDADATIYVDTRGGSGGAGARGGRGWDGQAGGKGGTGGRGGNGNPVHQGKSGGSGGPGGNGGNGGRGGRGGAGGNGGNGGNISIYVWDTGVDLSRLTTVRSGGAGGAGGPGGVAGRGGSGGPGGLAGCGGSGGRFAGVRTNRDGSCGTNGNTGRAGRNGRNGASGPRGQDGDAGLLAPLKTETVEPKDFSSDFKG